MTMQRQILHVDMDAFFASVEQLDNPQLRGKPVLVGGSGRRGVVSTASYEARPFGCRSAMPMAKALALCPQAIVVRGRMSRYADISRQVMNILESYSPEVQPVSIDEAFVDVTASQRAFGKPIDMARGIKARIQNEIGLTASVGLSFNKYLAKLASDLKKPDGLLEITPENLDATLIPLPISAIWGIGPKSAARLVGMNIRTIGDLRKMPFDFFVRRFGQDAQRVLDLSFGRDERLVVSDRDAKSISQEHTFGEDIIEPDVLADVLLGEVEQVANRLRRYDLRTTAIRLKIRYSDFKTISRSATLPEASSTTSVLWQAAIALLRDWSRHSFQPVRLLGFAASVLTTEPEQHGLFDQPESQRQQLLDRAVDRINQKFGKHSIERGRQMKNQRRPKADENHISRNAEDRE
jgi:DNA polymerase-4